MWDLIEDRARDDVKLSWAFVSFLTLASLIASVGRLLDEPILIVGAMVVGPEFAAVAAICLPWQDHARRCFRPHWARCSVDSPSPLTITTGLGLLVHLAGGFSAQEVAHQSQTDFIVNPDIWSFVIAVFAGIAGTLSLTTSKSATLVGVFISVTTVPAIGTFLLSLATANWGEAGSSLLQLSINLFGLVLAGTLTLLIQKVVWQHVLPAVASSP